MALTVAVAPMHKLCDITCEQQKKNLKSLISIYSSYQSGF